MRSDAQFVQTPHGTLFCLQRGPDSGVRTRAVAIFVQPLLEEANKSRRQWSLLAVALAEVGVRSLVFDLSGTGDSAGPLEACAWADWRANLASVVAHSKSAHPVPHIGVALRGGALIAVDEPAFDRLILWQPILSGEQWLTQFLRLAVAGGALRGEGGSTRALRDRLAADGRIEVAGYTLPKALFDAIDSAILATHIPDCPVDLAEFRPLGSATISPAMQGLVESWRRANVQIEPSALHGPSFWSTQEIATAPSLIDWTVGRIDAHCKGGM